MHESSTLTILQRQPADPQGQMIASLAEGSLEMTSALEKAERVFEEQITALRQQIGSLSITNGKLQVSLIASEGRNKQLEALLAATNEAHEAKAALQAQTQNEACRRMLARCKQIVEMQRQIYPAQALAIYKNQIRYDPEAAHGLILHPKLGPIGRLAFMDHLTKEIKKEEYLRWTDQSDVGIIDLFVGQLELEIGLLETDIKSLSGEPKPQ